MDTRSREMGKSEGTIQVWTAFCVGLGSGIGGVGRVVVAWLVILGFGEGFPYGILGVNLLGSFVIGGIAAMTGPAGRVAMSPARKQFLMAGICGGFTTYSLFILSSWEFLLEGEPGKALLYVIATLFGCMLAVWVGYVSGDRKRTA